LGGRIRVAVIFGVLILVLIPAGVAGGQTSGGWDLQASDSSVQDGDVTEQSFRQAQSAVVSVEQTDERLDVRIEARSDGTEASSQRIVVRSSTGDSDSSGSVQDEILVEQIGERERSRILRVRPASGQTELSVERELQIARQDIVARPVEEISKERYKKLYKKAAEKYGFGEDWYVLAAVGWIESRHGENMGPSSAGAMGPMQFLPSTWKTSGVDGNRDGVKNIMDPADAIPAAARYLKRGGAPEDWYAALFTYNHADWYVKDVLDSAERYRKLAKDERVGPYTTPDASR